MPGQTPQYSFGWRRPLQPHQGKILKQAPAGLDDDVLAIRRPVSLRRGMGRPYDQLGLGSCTANAVAKAVEFLLRRQGLSPFVLSRLALYLEGRRALGTIDEDSGAIIADVLAAAQRKGFGPEAIWPYAIDRFAEEPPQIYKDACNSARVIDWEPIGHDLATIYWTLAMGIPVVFGIEVYEGIGSSETASTGVVDLPRGNEPRIGGHGLVLTDFDPGTGWFGLMTSWGAWGPNGEGFGWIHKDYILDPGLCGEIHAINSVRVF